MASETSQPVPPVRTFVYEVTTEKYKDASGYMKWLNKSSFYNTLTPSDHTSIEPQTNRCLFSTQEKADAYAKMMISLELQCGTSPNLVHLIATNIEHCHLFEKQNGRYVFKSGVEYKTIKDQCEKGKWFIGDSITTTFSIDMSKIELDMHTLNIME